MDKYPIRSLGRYYSDTEGKRPKFPMLDNPWNSKFAGLIASWWHEDSSRRPSFRAIVKHVRNLSTTPVVQTTPVCITYLRVSRCFVYDGVYGCLSSCCLQETVLLHAPCAMIESFDAQMYTLFLTDAEASVVVLHASKLASIVRKLRKGKVKVCGRSLRLADRACNDSGFPQRENSDCIALAALCVDYFTRTCAEIDHNDGDFGGASPAKLQELLRYLWYFYED